MSYDISNIINLNVSISPDGLGFANFATAVMFAPETELPGGFLADTFRTYSKLSDMTDDGWLTTDETYIAMQRWLGGIPATNSVIIWGAATADATWTATLDKARNEIWWFWSFFTDTVYAAEADVLDIASWSNINESYFMNCQTGAAAALIRDENSVVDIATQLTTLGYRFASTFAHATDPYAGISVCKWFAAVNYSATRTAITGEYKKLSGVAAEDLPTSEYTAMKQDTKKCMFYTVVELQGSTDNGRIINSRSHSSFGEWMDDVVNLAAYSNNLNVELYNITTNPTTKLGQDPVGQSALIGGAKDVGEQYIANDYLGPRNYTDPDDGIDKFTEGYEILTQPEDILDISDSDRADRKSAPMKVRIFQKGAIHIVDISVSTF
jgi:hypothetical protein